MDKESQEEMMQKFGMFEQQIQQLQQQLQAIEQTIVEMNSLSFGLDDLKGSKGKEILAPIGRGVFTKTKLDSEKLIVDVGGKTFVEKNIPDTKKIIKEQIEKLETAKNEVQNSIEKINHELTHMMLEIQKGEKEKEHKH